MTDFPSRAWHVAFENNADTAPVTLAWLRQLRGGAEHPRVAQRKRQDEQRKYENDLMNAMMQGQFDGRLRGDCPQFGNWPPKSGLGGLLWL